MGVADGTVNAVGGLRRIHIRLAASEGATATEYAIMAFLIGVAVIVAVSTVGDRVVDMFEGLRQAMAEMLGG